MPAGNRDTHAHVQGTLGGDASRGLLLTLKEGSGNATKIAATKKQASRSDKLTITINVNTAVV